MWQWLVQKQDNDPMYWVDCFVYQVGGNCSLALVHKVVVMCTCVCTAHVKHSIRKTALYIHLASLRLRTC